MVVAGLSRINRRALEHVRSHAHAVDFAVDASSPVIVAQGIKFQTPDVKAPAGKAFAMTFRNQDSPPHNVSIFTDSSASQRVFQGEVFAQGERVYQVPALAAGTYFFRCDVHPDMTGTLTVG